MKAEFIKYEHEIGQLWEDSLLSNAEIESVLTNAVREAECIDKHEC